MVLSLVARLQMMSSHAPVAAMITTMGVLLKLLGGTKCKKQHFVSVDCEKIDVLRLL